MKSCCPAPWLALLTFFALLGPAQAATNSRVQAISVALPSRASFAAAGDSSAPLLSTDGRYVVFTSAADNLVTNDLNRSPNVFRYDRVSKEITLVSVEQGGTRSGNGLSVALDVSTNGQRVLFRSEARDLVGNDTNGMADLFVRDLAGARTYLVDVNTNGEPSGYIDFSSATLSADGRSVLFDSLATDLVPGGTSAYTQVYLRDLEAGTTLLVSVNTNGVTGGKGHSTKATITPDGKWAVFQSMAKDLVFNDNDVGSDIFLRDLQNSTTVNVSAGDSRYIIGGSCVTPAISDDMRYVAFHEDSSTGPVIWLRDLVVQTNFPISTLKESSIAVNPVVSPDGRYVAYESQVNLYCWDIGARQCFMLTTNTSGTGGGSHLSYGPQFSSDGLYCVFLSYATNLVSNGSNNPYQCQVYRRDMETGEIVLVSGNNLDAASPALNADASVIAFQSLDPLTADDFNESYDVFVRDLSTGSLEAISLRHPGLPSLTAAAPSFSWPNSISADGRYVLFFSTASNLVTDDTRGVQNLFVRDLATGSNQLVSASWDGVGCGDRAPYAPAISGDGRWVVFQSTATNQVPNDTNNAADIFLRDLQSGTNYLVSQSFSPPAGANSYSINPAVSANGQIVVFQSLATNLTANDANTGLDAFARNLSTGETMALSVSPTTGLCVGGQVNTGTGTQNPFAPLLTPDGQWVILWSQANLTTNANLVGNPALFAKNLQTGQTVPLGISVNGQMLAGNRSGTLSPGGRFAAFVTASNVIGEFEFASQTCELAASPGWNPSLSADGRWLAFESQASSWGTNSGNSVSDIFLLDRQNNTVSLISANRQGTGGGNGRSSSPLLSADARFLVFKSRASDLVDNDTNGVTDIFVRDLKTGALFPISFGLNGATGNGLSGNPVLGSDGRTVVFESFASDLVPGDFNQAKDVFVLQLSAGEPDFRVLTLTSLQGGGATVFWSSVSGRTYRLEYKDSLSDTTWQAVAGDVTATGSTASKADSSTALTGTRFYRVRFLY